MMMFDTDKILGQFSEHKLVAKAITAAKDFIYKNLIPNSKWPFI